MECVPFYLYGLKSVITMVDIFTVAALCNGSTAVWFETTFKNSLDISRYT